MKPGRMTPRASRHLGLLFLLFSAGWATNHFVALMPLLRARSDYPAGSIEIAFGLYALGLLPGLLGGGGLADRIHPRPLTLFGATLAAIGNLIILLGQSPITTIGGRFVVGLGVGLAISCGNAWFARLNPSGGSALAGTILTVGFGVGPFAAGVIAHLAPNDELLLWPFTASIALSIVSVLLMLLAWPRAVSAPSAPSTKLPPTSPLAQADSTSSARAPAVSPQLSDAERRLGAAQRHLGAALWRALPMALWVFTGVSTVIVVLAGRVGVSGPLLAGTIAVVTFAVGAITQAVAGRIGLGPRAGIVGVLFAALGFSIAALAGGTPGLVTVFICSLLLGISNGLCLRAGLLDLATLTPATRQGLAGGIFYVFTYLAFALPFIFEAIAPIAGYALPMWVIAALAVGTAVLRLAQLNGAVRRRSGTAARSRPLPS